MQEQKWDVILTSNKSFFDLQLKQVCLYRDLLMLFVKRDIISFYKINNLIVDNLLRTTA